LFKGQPDDDFILPPSGACGTAKERVERNSGRS